jgi:mono/diheme cytochrome c family protein
MKALHNFSLLAIAAILVVASGCGGDKKPGAVYMPDMAYSRTYEAYDQLDSTRFTGDIHKKGGTLIYFNAQPVPGTIKRGDEFPYTLPNDSIGYKQSAAIVNPITAMTAAEMSEAQRLYNINCGVCHGEKGKANGPLAGKVGGIVDLTLPAYVALADGTIFHSITYGKNNMGSYASQLNRKQRWEIVKYVRTLQAGTTPVTDSTAKPMADTAAVVKK